MRSNERYLIKKFEVRKPPGIFRIWEENYIFKNLTEIRRKNGEGIQTVQ